MVTVNFENVESFIIAINSMEDKSGTFSWRTFKGNLIN